MDSQTLSPNTLLSLLMDSQGGVASSLLVNLVPGLQDNAGKLWTNAHF
jgi:hypothetical protein